MYIFGIYVLILSAIFVALEHSKQIHMNRILKTVRTFVYDDNIDKGAHHEFSGTC